MTLFWIGWAAFAVHFLLNAQAPFLGNFSTKAVCYAMISKNFLRDPGTFLKPTLDILVAGKPSLHIVEFPWPSYVVAILQKAAPLGFEFWGRASSLLLLPVFFHFFRLFLRDLGVPEKEAEGASLFASFCPVTLVYFRSYQMDGWAMALFAVSLYQMRRSGPVFILAFSLALLLKPHWGILALPMFFAAADRKKTLGLLAASAALPALWVVWNFYLARTESSVFFSLADSLHHNSSLISRWIDPTFYMKIVRQLPVIVFGPLGVLLAVLGFGRGERPALDFMRAFSWACLAMLFLLARKFHEANYYYLPFVIPAGFFMQQGLQRLGPRARALMPAFMLLSAMIAVRTLTAAPLSERAVPEAGRFVDTHVPRSAKVAAISGTSPALLYYADRQGWTQPNEGADYFVTVDERPLPGGKMVHKDGRFALVELARSS